ncbi:MAG TPA: hypothetical protein VK519_09095 [Pinirhizobacter sp.]|nr:hypothetical protein [Pinirhizobacter sp.]HMH68064.1 hypothetical protein [Pinirhizobacter sp.]
MSNIPAIASISHPVSTGLAAHALRSIIGSGTTTTTVTGRQPARD